MQTVFKTTHIGSIPMIRLVGSASILAKYPPPSVNPAAVEGILVRVDHIFRDLLALKYAGHVRGSGLTGSSGEIRSEEVEGLAAVARAREEEAIARVRACWRDARGRSAALDIAFNSLFVLV